MPLIRPELSRRLRPWREVIAAALTGIAGLWLGSRGGLLLGPLGLAVIVVAALWGHAAWRRRRFLREIAAPGLVEVVEGAVRLYAAHAAGGEISLQDLSEIRLLRLGGRPHWRLRTKGGEALLVPLDAAGAEALADAFATLPGFDLGRATAALDAPANPVTVWTRS